MSEVVLYFIYTVIRVLIISASESVGTAPNRQYIY